MSPNDPGRCSRLSTTAKTRPRPSRARATVAIGTSPCSSSMPSRVAIVGTTSEASATGARSTNGAPPSAVLAASARLVFPVPPGPVSVTSRMSSRRSKAVIAVSSRARPISSPRGSATGSACLAGAADSVGSCSRIAPLEPPELRRGLEAKLVERVAGRAVRGERVGLPARAIKGDDPLRLESLPVRVGGGEGLELADERGVASRLEVERRCVPPVRPAGSRRAAPRRPVRTARRRGPRAQVRARARGPRGARPRPPRRAARSARRRARRARRGRGSRADGS